MTILENKISSNIGFGGILKQINPTDKKEYLIRFHSGKWTDPQQKYATVAHEMLTIVSNSMILDNLILFETLNFLFKILDFFLKIIERSYP